MINILIDKLPQSVTIDGAEYPVNSDFRACLIIMMAFEDYTLTDLEKQAVMLNILYPYIPENTQAAIDAAVWFLDCGEENEGARNGAGMRLYSFSKDAKYIYSAIKQSHGVDLETIEYLHWWKFAYMFLDLDKDCFFSQMLYYRKQRAKGKLTKEEAAFYNEIRDILELPQYHSQEELEAEDEFMRLLNGNI